MLRAVPIPKHNTEKPEIKALALFIAVMRFGTETA